MVGLGALVHAAKGKNGAHPMTMKAYYRLIKLQDIFLRTRSITRSKRQILVDKIHRQRITERHLEQNSKTLKKISAQKNKFRKKLIAKFTTSTKDTKKEKR